MDLCRDFERRDYLSDSTKGEIKFITFFKKACKTHRLIKLENLRYTYTSHHVSCNIWSKKVPHIPQYPVHRNKLFLGLS